VNLETKKISVILAKKILDLAISEGFDTVYFFTHDLSLNNFYQQCGEIIKPPSDTYFSYKEKPILLFKVNVNYMLDKIEKYFQENGIFYNEGNKVFLYDAPSLFSRNTL
jgi:hypothetical protein